MDHLISKYNTPVPRYTSYPPANFFHDNFAESQFWEAITHSNTQEPNHLSFYIHIPFCKRMCYYCGCNSFPMQQEQEVREYRDAIKREIN
ncbi:MAG TPA: coproporphyrinogen III oxidase, partial [Petrimonas sp.]|nr:coproporphyrinogen III oxidase [Petrimonas sp.]